MHIKKVVVSVAALFALVAAAPAASFAYQPAPGGYMSIFLGASAPQNAEVTSSEFNPTSVRDSQVEFDPGINVGGTAGYDFGYVRLEGEMSYKEGEISSVTDQIHGTHYINTEGHVGAFAMMVNTFFDLHNDSPITPYVGGGIGFASISLSNTKGVDAYNQGALNFHVFQSDQDSVLAYQLGAGVELPINPHLSLDLGYRYFGTSRTSFRNNWPNSTDLKLASHNAALGLRVKF